MDNLVKILPSVPSAKRVTAVDRRQRDNQQNSFKETLKEKQKKKKKKKAQVNKKISVSTDAPDKTKHTIYAGRKGAGNGGRSVGVPPVRIIDIRA